MTTKHVSVDLPADLWDIAGRDPELISARVREALVLSFVAEGEISAGYGARLLGLHLTEFAQLMARHGIPYFTDPLEDPADVDQVVANTQGKRDK